MSQLRDAAGGDSTDDIVRYDQIKYTTLMKLAGLQGANRTTIIDLKCGHILYRRRILR